MNKGLSVLQFQSFPKLKFAATIGATSVLPEVQDIAVKSNNS